MIGRRDTPEEDVQAEPKGFDDYDLLLGDIMRGERATMGKSLLDVQRELKIKATYIAAIENTDPTAFETPGFVAGYVRSYARYLGLDPEWAFKTFCEEGDFAVAHGMSSEASGAKPQRPQVQGSGKHGLRDPLKDPSVAFIPKEKARFSSFEPRALGSVAVLMVLIGGIGYGGWSVLQEVQKVRFTPVEQAPGVLSDLDPIASRAVPSTETSDIEVAQAGATAPSLEAMDRLYRPEALDVPVMVARDGPISTLDPSSVGALRPDMPAAGQFAELQNLPDGATPSLAPLPVPIQVVEENTREVVMFAVRPSWVRVRAANGTVIFEKILDAGEEFVLPDTEEPPVLRAGNAGSVYFRVNGQTYGPAGDGASVVRDVALGPQVLPERYEVADVAQDADLARIVKLAQINAATPAADDNQ